VHWCFRRPSIPGEPRGVDEHLKLVVASVMSVNECDVSFSVLRAVDDPVEYAKDFVGIISLVSDRAK
jgi:hypothetical protein